MARHEREPTGGRTGRDGIGERAGKVADRVERQLGEATEDPRPGTGPGTGGDRAGRPGPVATERVTDEIGGNPADRREDLDTGEPGRGR